MQMLESMEDERSFSTLSFMKSKLENYVNNHLYTVVGMYSQTLYILDTFPYDTCFDN